MHIDLHLPQLSAKAEEFVLNAASRELDGPAKRDAVVDALIEWLDKLDIIKPALVEHAVLAILKPALHLAVQGVYDRLKAAGKV